MEENEYYGGNFMRTYLVTGGAGFIGSNYIHYMFRKYGDTIRIINVDCLTYAGNLENLKDVENQPNYTFVKADICDSAAITKIFAFTCLILRRRLKRRSCPCIPIPTT